MLPVWHVTVLGCILFLPSSAWGRCIVSEVGRDGSF